ncbi:hypothetical protein VTK73DRAFT_3311 [Phialemonium thermophilum]|uniref:Uncharacterized protein n=1 Tax=Phialemonium thermophilum TaxID=223376 RepID=A0ABR3Y2D1_9PEZI
MRRYEREKDSRDSLCVSRNSPQPIRYKTVDKRQTHLVVSSPCSFQYVRHGEPGLGCGGEPHKPPSPLYPVPRRRTLGEWLKQPSNGETRPLGSPSPKAFHCLFS